MGRARRLWRHRPGNSVPRFHLTWGTGPGVLAPFVRRVREAEEEGLVTFRFRHQVDELVASGGAVTGVDGTVLEPSDAPRGVPSSREAVGEFSLDASAVIVTAAASAPTTTWCAATGPSGSAIRPSG